MQKDNLRKLFYTTASNFSFDFPGDDSFSPLFDMIHKETEKVPDEIIEKKFQQLWLLTNKEWHKKFNIKWGGYPSLAQWLEILVAKPLTDNELEKKKREYANNLRHKANCIIQCINAPFYQNLFSNRYFSPEFEHLKPLVDGYCKVKEKLPDERVRKMAEYLRGEYEKDKDSFFAEIVNLAKEQEPLLLT